jgi:hypothetical protein
MADAFMADTFMGRVKESVTRELWWPEMGAHAAAERMADMPSTTVIVDEDWRRISIGIIRAGGAIVPREQVRLMGNFLRVLEDAYLTANAGRARSGDFASFTYFRAQEAAIIDVMQTVRDVIDGSVW